MQEGDRLLEIAHAQAAEPEVGLYRQAGCDRRAALFYQSALRIIHWADPTPICRKAPE